MSSHPALLFAFFNPQRLPPQGMVALTSSIDKADAHALQSLLRSSLIRAADHDLWATRDNYEGVAKPLYGTSRYPWPLDVVLSSMISSSVKRSTARVGDVCQTESEVRWLLHLRPPPPFLGASAALATRDGSPSPSLTPRRFSIAPAGRTPLSAPASAPSRFCLARRK